MGISRLALLLATASVLVSFVYASSDSGKAGESAVLELNPENFDKETLNPEKHVFVMFYAPWCGHCKRLKPKWEELARGMSSETSVVIARLDADKHNAIAKRLEVRGYPTLVLFAKGKKEGVRYEGSRDVEALKEFIKSHM
uniref:Thioredoxin domain-containing protein n=1 Tax=Trypanosoma congolense (strain IL3000) TaxID=1068625 RepID=G0UQK2_TRYCI|nr:putative protein disulfide isomerase [Trypanosoma congolense IL3000]